MKKILILALLRGFAYAHAQFLGNIVDGAANIAGAAVDTSVNIAGTAVAASAEIAGAAVDTAANIVTLGGFDNCNANNCAPVYVNAPYRVVEPVVETAAEVVEAPVVVAQEVF